MKVLILGSSGIIGQHMRLCKPEGIEAVYLRKTGDRLHIGIDLNDIDYAMEYINNADPDVIVNLAGESSPDKVQNFQSSSTQINIELPTSLSQWCFKRKKHFIQISTQAVFSGNEPPYFQDSKQEPVNLYGKQKSIAEACVRCMKSDWSIIRPTFVLGIRPLPHIGRTNPIEQMLGGQNKQVNDRYFSVIFASELAPKIWQVINGRETGVHQFGKSGYTSRFDIAQSMGLNVDAVSHDSFDGIAERPVNTAYFLNKKYEYELNSGLSACLKSWESRQTLGIHERAKEISLFLGIHVYEAYSKLSKGFLPAHSEVSKDYKQMNLPDYDAILQWYRITPSYIWELSAYHLDSGFNYSGMCDGILNKLKAEGHRKILCLGDGIGDMTLKLRRAGLDAIYNDLDNSLTAKFASFRYWMHEGVTLPTNNNTTWYPQFDGQYDAIIACDVLEHVPNVSAWITAINKALVPGGRLMAQNAFAIGSGEDGSIPMHLSCNDHFEKDWDPMMLSSGFVLESSNWYRKI